MKKIQKSNPKTYLQTSKLEIKPIKDRFRSLKLCSYQKNSDYPIKEPKSKVKSSTIIDYKAYHFKLHISNIKINYISPYIMSNLGNYDVTVTRKTLHLLLKMIKHTKIDQNLIIQIQTIEEPDLNYAYKKGLKFLKKAIIHADYQLLSLSKLQQKIYRAPYIQNLNLHSIKNMEIATIGFTNLFNIAPILLGLNIDLRSYHCPIYDLFHLLRKFLSTKELKLQYLTLNAQKTKLISRKKIDQLISGSNLLKFAKKIDLQLGETIVYVKQRNYYDDYSDGEESDTEEEKEDKNQLSKPIEFVPFKDFEQCSLLEMNIQIESQQNNFLLNENQIFLKQQNSFSLSFFMQFMTALKSRSFDNQLSYLKENQPILDELNLQFTGCEKLLKAECLTELSNYLKIRNFSFKKIHLQIEKCSQITSEEISTFLQMVEKSKQTLIQFTITSFENGQIDSSLFIQILNSIKQGALRNCKLIELKFEKADKNFEDKEIKEILSSTLPLVIQRNLKKFEFQLDNQILILKDSLLEIGAMSNGYQLMYAYMDVLFNRSVIDSISIDFDYQQRGIEAQLLNLIDKKAQNLKKIKIFSKILLKQEEVMIQNLIRKHYKTLEEITVGIVCSGSINYKTTNLNCEVYLDNLDSRTFIDLVFKTLKYTLDTSGDKLIDDMIFNVKDVQVFVDSDLEKLRDILLKHRNKLRHCAVPVNGCNITEKGRKLVYQILK